MSKILKILGIDPGFRTTGLALIHCSRQSIVVYYTESIKLIKFNDPNQKLHHLATVLCQMVKIHRPHYTAVEQVFFARNFNSALKLGKVSGVIGASLYPLTRLTEYATKHIKMTVTGRGNATKKDVYDSLETIVDSDIQSISWDESDALGVAITHLYNLSEDEKVDYY